MKNNNKQDFIEHITEVLSDHREPYVLGSWERFQRFRINRKRSRRNQIIVRIAAAILLIFTFYFGWTNIDRTADEWITGETPAEIPEPVLDDNKNLLSPDEAENLFAEQQYEHPDDWPVLSESTGSEQEETVAGTFPPVEISPSASQSVKQYTLTETVQETILENRLLAFSKSDKDLQNPIQPHETTESDVLPAGEMNAEQILTGEIKNSHKKDFSFSLAYASLLNIHDSQADLGSGGGFYTDWNFAEKFSLTSGLIVAQNRLKYSFEHGELLRTFEEDGNETTLANSDNLSHIQVNLLSLEIPFNFRYSINGNFSVTAGISSVTFLKEQYDYTFEFQQQVHVVVDGDDGPETTTETITFSETQQQTEPSLNGMDWAAFYTVSMGYQHIFADRHTVSLEPFVKIPTRGLASRDIRYTTGGIQFKVYF